MDTKATLIVAPVTLILAAVLFANAIGRKNNRLPINPVEQFAKSTDGSGASLNELGIDQKNLAGKLGLIVAMGSCESCSESKYSPGSESEKYEYVILAFDDVSNHSKKFELSKKYRVVFDSMGLIHRRLNAFSTPRGYEVGPSAVVQLAETESPTTWMFERNHEE